MGASASVAKLAHEANSPDEEYYDGCPLSVLGEFIRKNGGEEVFEELSCHEVFERFITPSTNGQKESSLCTLKANRADLPRVKKSTTFVTYCRSSPFIELYRSLIDYVGGDTDAYVWLDILCDTYNMNYENYVEKMKKLMKNVDHTILMLDPSKLDFLLKDAKFLFDLYCINLSENRFEVVLCTSGQHQFLKMLKTDFETLCGQINSTDIRNATYGSISAKDILKATQEKVDVKILNSSIVKSLKDWMITVLEGEIGNVDANRRDMSSRTPGDILALMFNLAQLLEEMMYFEKAEKIYNSCLVQSKLLFGEI